MLFDLSKLTVSSDRLALRPVKQIAPIAVALAAALPSLTHLLHLVIMPNIMSLDVLFQSHALLLLDKLEITGEVSVRNCALSRASGGILLDLDQGPRISLDMEIRIHSSDDNRTTTKLLVHLAVLPRFHQSVMTVSFDPGAHPTQEFLLDADVFDVPIPDRLLHLWKDHEEDLDYSPSLIWPFSDLVISIWYGDCRATVAWMKDALQDLLFYSSMHIFAQRPPVTDDHPPHDTWIPALFDELLLDQPPRPAPPSTLFPALPAYFISYDWERTIKSFSFYSERDVPVDGKTLESLALEIPAVRFLSIVPSGGYQSWEDWVRC